MTTQATSTKRKKVPSGGHRLTDAAGRPVIGMWGNQAKPVLFWYPEKRGIAKVAKTATGRPRTWCERPDCVRVAGNKRLWRARFMMAPACTGFPEVPLLKSLKTASHEHWWVSASGALERPATLYEERLPDLPPQEGWTLVPTSTAQALVGYQRQSATLESETSRAERQAAAERKAAKLAEAQSHAASMVAKYTRRLALDKTLLKKWQKIVLRLEKRATKREQS